MTILIKPIHEENNRVHKYCRLLFLPYENIFHVACQIHRRYLSRNNHL